MFMCGHAASVPLASSSHFDVLASTLIDVPQLLGGSVNQLKTSDAPSPGNKLTAMQGAPPSILFRNTHISISVTTTHYVMF